MSQCLDSLLSKTLYDIEVIFVDDRGSDNSIDVIHNYIVSHHLEQDWHVIASPQNSGPALTRNSEPTVQGEYIAFVDADDWIENWSEDDHKTRRNKSTEPSYRKQF